MALLRLVRFRKKDEDCDMNSQDNSDEQPRVPAQPYPRGLDLIAALDKLHEMDDEEAVMLAGAGHNALLSLSACRACPARTVRNRGLESQPF
jgi:hypothetical protein